MTGLRSSRRPDAPGRPAPLTRPAGMAYRTAAALAAAAAAGLLAAGCSAPAGPRSAGAALLPTGAAHAAPTVLPSTTPASTASGPTSTVPASGPASPVPGVPVTPPAAGPAPTGGQACTSAGLKLSIGPPSGAAGSIYYPIDFWNVSGAACTMYGYPGVSFVAAPGSAQLGGQAVRDAAFRPAVVTLAPGAAAHASVQVVVAQNYVAAQCKPVTAHFLRVYPPGQFTPLYTSLTALTCTGAIPGGSTLGIYVVRPGANGP